MEDVHFPGKTEEEFPVEVPTPAEVTPKAEVPKEDAPKGDDPKPGDEAPKDAPKEDAPKDEPKDPEPIKNKRSIYDDLKDEKRERKSAEARLKELEEENARLKADKPADAPKPDKPADELETFAHEQGIDPKTVERLAEIVAKRVPQADLTKEERQQLADLKTWQQGKLAEDARAAEDREILGQAPSVKTQLQIHDDAELQKVMAEIVKLAHTERFHDKEVGYIIWANREPLSKLVSPKKPSFESGNQAPTSDAPAEVEFSGKMTPTAAQKAVESSYPKSGIVIRKGS